MLLSSAPVCYDGSKSIAHKPHHDNSSAEGGHDGRSATTPALLQQPDSVRLEAMLAACNEAEGQAAVMGSGAMPSRCKEDQGGSLATAGLAEAGGPLAAWGLGGGSGHGSSRRRRNAGLRLHSNALFWHDEGWPTHTEPHCKEDGLAGHGASSSHTSSPFLEACSFSAGAAQPTAEAMRAVGSTQPTAEAVCAAMEAQLSGVRQRHRMRRMSSETSCGAVPQQGDPATDCGHGEEGGIAEAFAAAAAMLPFSGNAMAAEADHHHHGLDGCRPQKKTAAEDLRLRSQFMQLVQACRRSALVMKD